MKQFFLSTRNPPRTALRSGLGSSDSAPTKAEFVEQANAICEASVNEQRAAFKKAIQESASSSNESAIANKLVTEVMLPANQKQIDELRALEAPNGDEQQIEAILAAMQQGVDAAKEEPPQKFISTEGTLEKGRSLAGAYGLKACS